ncbi:hypothetical protein QEZ54_34390 [Catellatospora sp. KI3]|uniref:hypothetical protein n=1 Tax=Catellatospora sp. KI3 TaxID=3041620 RepID=UPI0024824378|nr:hypothetical protein [Catellatospora sp. KI3]MDI1466077.1 hypothetical protein [Catellatospora sp. KI3]
MTTPTELAGIIEFQLQRLRAQNRHHDFEHLCRNLVRVRIASNILPATGPVAGSGDKGRDFETFHTYLARSLDKSSAFVRTAAADRVVFACTVQQGAIPAKVRADVDVICAAGTPVHRIYFFCTEPVKVADRHNLQAWAAEAHQVALEIIDGPSIAELLSDQDVFWIAKQYLHMPTALSPSTAPEQVAPRTRRTSIRQADHEMARAIDLLATHTAVSPEEMTPLDFRAAFAADLASLYRMARRPDIGAVAEHLGIEERKVTAYLSGMHLPSRTQVGAMVRVLADHARSIGIEVPPDLVDIPAWERKWRIAKKRGMQKILINKVVGPRRRTPGHGIAAPDEWHPEADGTRSGDDAGQ